MTAATLGPCVDIVNGQACYSEGNQAGGCWSLFLLYSQVMCLVLSKFMAWSSPQLLLGKMNISFCWLALASASSDVLTPWMWEFHLLLGFELLHSSACISAVLIQLEGDILPCYKWVVGTEESNPFRPSIDVPHSTMILCCSCHMLGLMVGNRAPTWMLLESPTSCVELLLLLGFCDLELSICCPSWSMLRALWHWVLENQQLYPGLFPLDIFFWNYLFPSSRIQGDLQFSFLWVRSSINFSLFYRIEKTDLQTLLWYIKARLWNSA